MILVSTLLVLTLSSSVWSADCPRKETSSQCYCEHGVFYEGFGTKVSCRSIRDTKSLYREIQKYQGYHIDVLKLIHVELPFLPSGLFNGTIVRSLYLENSKLGNLYSIEDSYPSPFAGLQDYLEEIHVHSTSDPSKWYWPDMKNFKKMRIFDIVLSPIDFVGHHFAEIGGGSLEVITVTQSRAYRIHPQAFPELTNMIQADFSGNFLPYLVRTMFPNPAFHLERLSFRDNALFTLPENMFENMPALMSLDLSQNEFKTLDTAVFTPVWSQLQFFYISSNPFLCDCSLSPLKERFISGSCPRHNDVHAATCSNHGDPKKTLLLNVNFKELQCSQ